jgi:hypothetical protein
MGTDILFYDENIVNLTYNKQLVYLDKNLV